MFKNVRILNKDELLKRRLKPNDNALARKIISRIRRPFSATYYKDAVNLRNYKFVETSRWNYIDPHKEDLKYDFEFERPHLVLQDKTGRARFVLPYLEYKDEIVILDVQRLRTRKTLEEETSASKEFQDELGMHPSEFLLCEFINRFRAKIKAGKKLILRSAVDAKLFQRIYSPLVERFFKPQTSNDRLFNTAELNLDKERVKALLQ